MNRAETCVAVALDQPHLARYLVRGPARGDHGRVRVEHRHQGDGGQDLQRAGGPVQAVWVLGRQYLAGSGVGDDVGGGLHLRQPPRAVGRIADDHPAPGQARAADRCRPRAGRPGGPVARTRTRWSRRTWNCRTRNRRTRNCPTRNCPSRNCPSRSWNRPDWALPKPELACPAPGPGDRRMRCPRLAARDEPVRAALAGAALAGAAPVSAAVAATAAHRHAAAAPASRSGGPQAAARSPRTVAWLITFSN